MKGPRCKPIAISHISDLNWESFSCVIDDDLKAVCMTPDGKIVHLVGRKPRGWAGSVLTAWASAANIDRLAF